MTKHPPEHSPGEERLIKRPSIIRKRVTLAEIEPWQDGGGIPAVNRSMEALGSHLSEPLLQRTGDETHPYRVVDGARRLTALRESGATALVAKIIPQDYEAALVTVAMNLNRAPNAAREAVALGELLERGHDEKSIGQLLGIPVTLIRRRLRLLDLPVELFDGVMEGKIKASIAHRLSALRDDLKVELVRVYQQTGRLTGRDVENANRALRESTVDRFAKQGLFEVNAEPIDTVEREHTTWLHEQLRAARESGMSRADIDAILDDLYEAE